MDDATEAKRQLREMINRLRRVLKENDRLSDMAISSRYIDSLCDGGAGCSDEDHGDHHLDMAMARRALDAAFNRWAELRAHLAIASHALRPRETTASPEDTAPLKDPSELN